MKAVFSRFERTGVICCGQCGVYATGLISLLGFFLLASGCKSSQPSDKASSSAVLQGVDGADAGAAS
jgi:hypothetical protein